MVAAGSKSKEIKAKEQKLAWAENNRTNHDKDDLKDIFEGQPVARPRPRPTPTPKQRTISVPDMTKKVKGMSTEQIQAYLKANGVLLQPTKLVDTDSAKGTKTTSGPGKSTVPDDSMRVDEPEEVHPAIVGPSASISSPSENAVLDVVAGGVSDDAAGSPAEEGMVVQSTAENEPEPPPTTPEVEDEEAPLKFKRKVCHDPVSSANFDTNDRT